jgi:NADH-quinone oxidoreductase subunit A
MLFHFGAVGAFLLVSFVFIFGTLLVGRLARPSEYEPGKRLIYECGEPTIGPAWIRYNIRFYTIALVYLVFDVEVVFLFPVALVLKEFKEMGLGALAFFEIVFFAGVLLVGLAYAWRYGSLDWMGGEKPKEEETSEAA